MIQTHTSRQAAHYPKLQANSSTTLKEVSGPSHDRFDLSGVSTAVKLYDMSPIWGPHYGPVKIPMFVHGLV